MVFRNPRNAMPQGRIEVIAGGMFSGKSEELIRRVRRAAIAKQRVQVFKPKIDDRFSTTAVVSHIKNEVSCTSVEDSAAVAQAVADDTEVIAVDEAQFFDDYLVRVAMRLAHSGKRVIVAGLDMDSEGAPFGPIPNLMAVAEDVVKLHAVCVSCGEDASVSYHKGKGVKTRQVEVGADQYEARCRACFNRGNAYL